MKKSLILTRGEVNAIIRRALRTRGVLPDDLGKHARVFMEELRVPADDLDREPAEKDAPWDTAPAVLYTWTEEIPDEPVSVPSACTGDCAAKPGSPLLCPSCLARQKAGLSNSKQSS